MGKKGKEPAEEEGYEFTAPDFDEEAFIHKEMSSFRSTLIMVPWGILVAVLSWGIYVSMGGGDLAWFVTLAVAAAGGYALKFIFPKMGADVSHYQRREWTGVGFIFFFTWLGVFLLLVNPPISDMAPPSIEIVASPPLQVTGGDMEVHIFVADNGKLGDIELALWKDGQLLYGDDAFETSSHGRHVLSADNLAAGNYQVLAHAVDAKGNEASANMTILVDKAPATLNIPSDARLDGATDQVEVLFPTNYPACSAKRIFAGTPCVRTVSLQLDNGNTVLMQGSDSLWTADVRQAGWTVGAQNNFSVHAQMATQFVGKQAVPPGIIELGPKAVFVADGVLPAGEQGSEVASHVPDLSQAPARQVPGPGVAIVVVGLLAVAFVARRK